MTNYRGYIKADLVNGIYKIDYCDMEPSDDVLTVDTFIDSLDSLDDDECLITFIDHEHEGHYDDLHKEYGIS